MTNRAIKEAQDRIHDTLFEIENRIHKPVKPHNYTLFELNQLSALTIMCDLLAEIAVRLPAPKKAE